MNTNYNKKIYFIRDTHDENRNYRGDSYFGELDPKRELPMGVHTWAESGKKLTFDEIYNENVKAYNQGACDGLPMEIPNDYENSIEGMLKALAYMIEKKLVKVEIMQ